MGAFGKTLAAGTLAFGALGSGFSGNMGWHNPHESTYKHDDDKTKHADYDGRDWKNGDKFYELSWDKQHKLCSDDRMWDAWSYKNNYNDERDSLCKDHWDNDYGNRGKGYDDDHGKDVSWAKGDDYSPRDWNSDDWGKDHDRGKHDDDSRLTAYHRNEEARQSYSAHDEEHEKQAFVLAASSNHESDDSDYGYNQYDGHDGDKGYGHDGWNKNDDHGYGNRDWEQDHSSDKTSVAAYGAHQRDAEASVNAETTQAVVVNNFNYINGDNNVVNNNISVATTAMTEQKASTSESSQFAVNYQNSSDNEQNRGYDDWGDDWNGNWNNGSGSHSSDSSDESFKLAAMSEKSSSSEVKQTSSYNLDETYVQASHEGDGRYGHDGDGHDGDDCGDYAKYDEDCVYN